MTPGIETGDLAVTYWIARINMILRREVAWCWRLRSKPQDRSPLPPVVDAAGENLDLVRYEDEKSRFFETNPTARYLSDALAALEEQRPAGTGGYWCRLVDSLSLDETAQFLLALVLAGRLDA
jgi:hypothetical protein